MTFGMAIHDGHGHSWIPGLCDDNDCEEFGRALIENERNRIKGAIAAVMPIYWPRLNGIPPKFVEDHLRETRDRIIAAVDAAPVLP